VENHGKSQRKTPNIQLYERILCGRQNHGFGQIITVIFRLVSRNPCGRLSCSSDRQGYGIFVKYEQKVEVESGVWQARRYAMTQHKLGQAEFEIATKDQSDPGGKSCIPNRVFTLLFVLQ
jgi:hypothetical protein